MKIDFEKDDIETIKKKINKDMGKILQNSKKVEHAVRAKRLSKRRGPVLVLLDKS